MEKKCCICGKEFNGFGNNPMPIKEGVCCDNCNIKFVIPSRFISGICSYEIVKNTKAWKELEIKLLERDFEQIYRNESCDMYCFQNPETEEKVIVYCV